MGSRTCWSPANSRTASKPSLYASLAGVASVSPGDASAPAFPARVGTLHSGVSAGARTQSPASRIVSQSMK